MLAESLPIQPPGLESATENLLQSIAVAPAPGRRVDGLEIGWLRALEGPALVLIPAISNEPLPARSLCPLGPERLNKQCAVMFEQGDPARPLIMGFLEHEVLKEAPSPLPDTLREAIIDGQRITFEAKDEIVLKCGKASIRLTKAGRVELRGATVVSHSTGLNRIRGASVKLN